MQSEIKKNIQGTNSDGKENRTQINSWSRRKKKHSPRPAGGAEMGSRAERTHGEAVGGGLGVPHSHADKLGGTTGEQADPQPRVPAQGNKASNL